jgi:hypothetical protein
MSEAEAKLREWFQVHGERGLMTSSPLTLLAQALAEARNAGLEEAAQVEDEIAARNAEEADLACDKVTRDARFSRSASASARAGRLRAMKETS